MRAIFRRLFLVIPAILAGYAALLIHPDPAFAHSYDYKNIHVASDRPIDAAIEARLETALGLLERSELYKEDMRFSIYIAHDRCRLAFFTRNSKIGGMVNGVISQNVFLRESDIKANQLISPTGKLMNAKNRPLTYFLTHEMTHALQARRNRWERITAPQYIREGYADYIAKGPNFDFEQALSDLRAGHDFYAESSPLYNRHHIVVAFLMDQQGLSYDEIVKARRPFENLLAELR